MMDWLFSWHCLENTRYMIWFKKCYFGTLIREQDRERILSPAIPIVEKYYSTVH